MDSVIDLKRGQPTPTQFQSRRVYLHLQIFLDRGKSEKRRRNAAKKPYFAIFKLPYCAEGRYLIHSQIFVCLFDLKQEVRPFEHHSNAWYP